MEETFRSIIDSFADRQALAVRWNAHAPIPYRVTVDAITLWRHRDSIPGWAWVPLQRAAADLGVPDVTVERLGNAKEVARRQRARTRAA